MATLTTTEQPEANTEYGVVLTRGKTQHGEPFYVYIKATQDSVKKMQADYQNQKSVNFFEYGEVLFYGPGHEPPEEIKQRVQEKYGGDSAEHDEKKKSWWPF